MSVRLPILFYCFRHKPSFFFVTYHIALRCYSRNLKGHSNLLNNAFKHYEDIKLSLFRVGDCALGDSFSRAQIEVMQYLEDKSGKIVRPLWAPMKQIYSKDIFTRCVEFSSVFENGFRAIQDQDTMETTTETQSKNGQKSVRDLEKLAVSSLNEFLSKKEFHEECLEVLWYNQADYNIKDFDKVPELTEQDTAVLLANHLFSQMISNSAVCNNKSSVITEKYIINHSMTNRKRHCPCAKCCGAEIKYGNTEFGSEYLWFGQTDVIVLPVGGAACSIVIPAFSDDTHNEESESTQRQIRENSYNESALRNFYAVKQIVAQAITFSFYQRKCQIENLNTKTDMFIPTIAACSDSFDVYLYDCENDILLRNMGDPIPFFTYGKFNISAILQLWMIMNYKTFSPGLEGDALEMLRDTCGFRKKLNSLEHNRLDYIMKTLSTKEHYRGKFDPEYDNVYVEVLSSS